MILDGTLLAVTLVGGGAVIASTVAVVREVSRDGFGVRPCPRSLCPHEFDPGAPRPSIPRPSTSDVRLGTRLLVGLALYGAAIALIVRAGLGVGPWDVLAQGVAATTGVSFGLTTNLIGALVLVLWWPLRQRPRVGTAANVLLVGSSAQAVLALTRPVDGLGAQIALLVGGIVLLAFATAVYTGAGLGAGPRDGLMLGLHWRCGLPIWLARTLVEGSALLGGWLLGGNVGIGTVVFAASIGPLCAVAIRLLPPAPLHR